MPAPERALGRVRHPRGPLNPAAGRAAGGIVRRQVPTLREESGPRSTTAVSRGAVPSASTRSARYCPLCRSAAVIRSLSPETLARLADLATVAATVLADLASTRTSGDGGDGAATRPARPEPSAAQPIPVSDDDPPEAPHG